MNIYSSKFIGQFKTGDNINYNLRCLTELENITSSLSRDEKKYFIKFKILIIGSIIEAVMYDLMLKIRTYTNEGVPNIPKEKITKIKSKKPSDKLAQLIDLFRKYELLGDNKLLYEDIDDIRKLRNRIHIQNVNNYEHRDELLTFTNAQLKLTIITLKKILKIMDEKYSRAKNKHHCADFELPW